MIVSVHVPKCAGTSFRRILARLCGARIWFNYGTIFSRDQARAELVPPGTAFIHGHFLADAFDDLFPNRRLVAWVRHPVERLVSNYHHFIRTPDMRDACCRALHEQGLSLRQFADLEWMQNEMTRYLANNPADAFQFIGVSEMFRDSMEHFCETFGFRSVGVIPIENVNPDRRTERYALSREDFAYILDRNAADLALFDAACERLEGARRLSRLRFG